MDIVSYNRKAWDLEVERGNRWSCPVTPEVIAAARRDIWDVVLTPKIPVPRAWFPELKGLRILCLAGGGGQQGPIFAAAGAVVTVFDNSPAQLAQDTMVAQREQLSITTVQGDMADLSCFMEQSFDLIFHPCSNCFVPDVNAVWRECHRVLRSQGILMSGFINPVLYTFDQELKNTQSILQVRYALPYSDLTSLTDEERQRYTVYHAPLEFSHTLEDQIGGQLRAGFLLSHFFEDNWGGEDIVDKYFKGFIATRAVKV